MKLRTVLLGIAGFTCAGLLILIAAWAVWLHVEKSRVAEMKAEMRAEGLPMTVADLEPAPLGEADNAAPLLERAAELLKELKKREGWIDAVPGPGREGERNPTSFDEAKLAALREQMAWPETQEVLRLLREAAAKPGARFERVAPPGGEVGLMPLQVLGGLIEAVRLLGTSAWLKALDGQGEVAASELLAVIRIAGQLHHNLLLADWLAVISIEHLSVTMGSGVVAVLPAGSAQSPKWSELRGIWASLAAGVRADLADVLDAERVYVAGALMEQLTDGKRSLSDVITKGLRLMERFSGLTGFEQARDRPEHWDMFLLAANAYAHPGSPFIWADRAAYLDLMRKLRFAASNRAGWSRKQLLEETPRTAFLSRTAAPSMVRAFETADRLATQLQIGQVGLALERWRADHGRYPASLEELGLPEADTKDPFSGQPLVYRVENDGVLLYSVGPDGQDDGGRVDRRGDLVWLVQCDGSVRKELSPVPPPP